MLDPPSYATTKTSRFSAESDYKKLAAACFALHAGFEQLLAASVPAYAPLRSGVEHAVMILVALLFLAVLVFQSQLPAWASRPAFQRLYVHASNGFYLGTLFNRITQKFIA